MVGFHFIYYGFWTNYVVPFIINAIIGVLSLTTSWFSWTRQSNAMLRHVERRILSCVKTAYKKFYVDIGPVVGESDKIWTIAFNNETQNTPIVLLHGMGSGLALWCANYDAIAATRPVYAIDLLGFGRSSRSKFDCNAEKVEAQWVESVEQWRREVNLKQFILLGHSLGGYISTAYAMKYPERVRHLILADPWGFTEMPANVYEKYQLSFLQRALVTAVQPLNPLWALRAAGPAGRWLVSKTRPDLARKYMPYVPDAESLIPDYLHQCNAQSPTGEGGFHTLMHGFGWAKNPLVHRLDQLHPNLPITVLYGSRSWVDNATADMLKQQRPHTSKTYVQVINGAGHHVYLDKVDLFNKYVLEACKRADDYNPGILSDDEDNGDVVTANETPKPGQEVDSLNNNQKNPINVQQKPIPVS